MDKEQSPASIASPQFDWSVATYEQSHLEAPSYPAEENPSLPVEEKVELPDSSDPGGNENLQVTDDDVTDYTDILSDYESSDVDETSIAETPQSSIQSPIYDKYRLEGQHIDLGRQSIDAELNHDDIPAASVNTIQSPDASFSRRTSSYRDNRYFSWTPGSRTSVLTHSNPQMPNRATTWEFSERMEGSERRGRDLSLPGHRVADGYAGGGIKRYQSVDSSFSPVSARSTSRRPEDQWIASTISSLTASPVEDRRHQSQHTPTITPISSLSDEKRPLAPTPNYAAAWHASRNGNMAGMTSNVDFDPSSDTMGFPHADSQNDVRCHPLSINTQHYPDEKRALAASYNRAEGNFHSGSVPSSRASSISLNERGSGRPLQQPFFDGIEVVPQPGLEAVDTDVPPAYHQLSVGNGQLQAEITRNGRISMFINSNMRIPEPEPEPSHYQESTVPELPAGLASEVIVVPRLNIVIQVVGSRGDVQPFVALGTELQRLGHRVRLATHDVFESFVKASGLEFFPIGGDPEQLMAYMVNNPSLIPNFSSFRAGDIKRQRQQVLTMLEGCWRSCIEPCPETSRPFVANAIIANPPSFAHIHCAQALGIPVHMMFTMPWSPTRAFPHPLANVFKKEGVEESNSNWLSYGLVEMMTWQGLAETINMWRKRSLNLEPVRAMMGAGLADYLKVPFTYCWSPSLVPKPRDWPSHIDVCGFFFRNAPDYTPPREIDDFLRAGSTPIYVGFGSIVMKEPKKMTEIVMQAVRDAGVRAIISKGWSNLGEGEQDENMLFIGDCPHEWLFQHVSAVVHHGGAGTTACGLRNGRPTTIVPFFGDQSFWGSRIHAAGAGPPPIDNKLLTATTLAAAIRTCLMPQTLEAAQKISQNMSLEDGVQQAVKSFHRNLPLEQMRCDLIPTNAAVWQYDLDEKGKKKDKQTVKLCDEAAFVLMERGAVKMKNIQIYKPKPIEIDHKRWDPLTAGSSTLVDTMMDLSTNSKDMFVNPYRELRKAHTLRREQSGSSSGSISSPSLRHSASMSTLSTQSTSLQTSPVSSTEISGLRGGGSEDSVKGKGKEISNTLLKHPHNHAHTGAAAAATVATRELGKLSGGLAKGMLLDLPVALADGFHNMPVLYGDKRMERGDVRGWKSGMVVGSKALAVGFYEGFTGIVTAPAKGAVKDGGIGFAKGFVTGTLGVLFKPGAAMLGFVGYPLLGAYKSISSLHATQAESKILLAKQIQGSEFARREPPSDEVASKVLSAFTSKKQLQPLY